MKKGIKIKKIWGQIIVATKSKQKNIDLELAVGGSVSEALNFVEFIDRLGACNKMKRVEIA